MLKFVKSLLIIILFLAALGSLGLWYLGAWRLVFPSHHHDIVPPALPSITQRPSILVFSKTNSFRHTQGIKAGATALRSIASRRDWDIFHTENGAVFNSGDLANFEAVVFLNATGDMLSSTQEQAFQSWLESGGGWLGIHAAGDGSHTDWNWYQENLIGVDFTAHPMNPQFQVATVLMENHSHPVVQNIPNIWGLREEWYSWAKSPRGEGFTILATLDEDSYSPVQKIFAWETNLHMIDHPVVWANCVLDGRAVYTAMGHNKESFRTREVLTLLENSLTWLMSREGNCKGQFNP